MFSYFSNQVSAINILGNYTLIHKKTRSHPSTSSGWLLLCLKGNHHILVDLELDEAAHYFGCKLEERNIDRHRN